MCRPSTATEAAIAATPANYNLRDMYTFEPAAAISCLLALLWHDTCRTLAKLTVPAGLDDRRDLRGCCGVLPVAGFLSNRNSSKEAQAKDKSLSGKNDLTPRV